MPGLVRGPQPADEMVDTLSGWESELLFTIGGDGTLRGGAFDRRGDTATGAEDRRGGCPKTIDNDISFIDMSFGFDTAVEAARPGDARGIRGGVVPSVRYRSGEADGSRLRVHRQLRHAGGYAGRPMPDPRSRVQHSMGSSERPTSASNEMDTW